MKGRVDILNAKNKSTAMVPSSKKSFDTKKKKIAAGVIGTAVLAAVVVLVLVLVFDLGPVRPIESTEEEARVVGTVSGFEVRYEELRYITLSNRADLDNKYGKYDTLSDDDKAIYEAELEALVLEDVKSNYAVLALCQQYGVDADSRDADKYVKNSVADFIDEIGGKAKYKEWLSKNNLTDSFLRLMYRVAYLETALVDKLTAEGVQIKYN